MSMTQWWKVATVLMVACATASGVEWLDQGERRKRKHRPQSKIKTFV